MLVPTPQYLFLSCGASMINNHTCNECAESDEMGSQWQRFNLVVFLQDNAVVSMYPQNLKA